MAGKVCSLGTVKVRSWFDALSTIFSDRTAKTETAQDLAAAKSGIPVPEDADVKLEQDAASGRASFYADKDEAELVEPAINALQARAKELGMKWKELQEGVSAYWRTVHIPERIRTFILRGRNASKVLTDTGRAKQKEYADFLEVFNADAEFNSPERNAENLMRLYELQYEFFADETNFQKGWKEINTYEGISIQDAEDIQASLNPEFARFYDENFDLFEAMRERMNARRKESNYAGPVVEFTRQSHNWQNYVPLKSVQAEDDLEAYFDDFDVWESTGYLNDTDNALTKGRTTTAADPFEQMVSDLYRSGKKLADSRVARAVMKFAETYQGYVDITIGPKINMTAINTSRDKESSLGIWSKSQRIARKPNTIVVHEGDSARVLTIRDPHLFVGLKNQWLRTSDAANTINKYTLRPIGMLKTYYNAPWVFYTNFVREFRQQLIYGSLDLAYDDKGNFSFALPKAYMQNVFEFGGFRDAIKYHTQDILGKEKLEAEGSSYAKWANQLARLGGESTFVQSFDIRSVQEKMEEMFAENMNPTLRTRFKKADQFYGGLVNGVDLSTRVALFKAIVEQGRLSPEAAAIYVKNLMNFNYRGKWGDGLRAMYLFYGPSAAGAFRMVRTFIRADNPAQMAALTATFSASIGAAYMAASAIAGTDDDGEDLYKKIDNNTFIRGSILPVAGDDKAFVQIPRAIGLEQLLATPGILAARLALGHTTPSKAISAFTRALIDNSSFLGPADAGDAPVSGSTTSAMLLTVTPSLFRPILETRLNQSSQGLQIWNQYADPSKPGYMQGRDNTDEVYAKMAEAAYSLTNGQMDFAPETLKHLAGQYLGFPMTTLNRFLTWNDKIMRGDPITATDVPFMPTISTKDVIYYPQRSFSQIRGEWRIGLQGYNIALEKGEAPDPTQTLAYTLDNQIQKYDRAINAQIKKLRAHDMPPEEKARAIKSLLERRSLIRLDLAETWEKSNE